jgi:hypothetical protein
MPLYYTPESNDIQKGRSARASDFVEDKDIKEHNEKISKLPKDKKTGKPIKEKKPKSKLAKPKTDVKPSGKFSKTGQMKVEAANARNAGRNIMGTAGGLNSDKYSTQARGASSKFRARGTPVKATKALDDIQTGLSNLLQVMKQEKRDEVKAMVFKSLDDSMNQLRKELNY